MVKNLRDRPIRLIFDTIFQGKLKAGDRLPTLDAMAREHHMSVASVREAIHKLSLLQQRTHMLRGTIERAHTFHPKIAAALMARDGASAQALISEHLESVMKAWSALDTRGVRRGKALTKGGRRRIGGGGNGSRRGL